MPVLPGIVQDIYFIYITYFLSNIKIGTDDNAVMSIAKPYFSIS